jgi:hypothetical protein
MQYSGSYSYHTFSYRILNGYNWFLEFYFNTCITTDFVIFSIQSKNMQQTSGGTAVTPFTYFSLGVNGDGYYYIMLALVNNEVLTQYREVATTLQVASGWNYVAINLDEIYEYSYVTMYNRYEGMTIQSVSTLPSYGYYHRKYTTFFAGEYDENTYDYAGSLKDLAIVMGCRIEADFTS